MTEIETIRRKAHLSLAFKNTYLKLACIASEKRNWKLQEEYGNLVFAYDLESSAYNDCLEILDENPEEADKIAETIFNQEITRL